MKNLKILLTTKISNKNAEELHRVGFGVDTLQKRLINTSNIKEKVTIEKVWIEETNNKGN